MTVITISKGELPMKNKINKIAELIFAVGVGGLGILALLMCTPHFWLGMIVITLLVKL
jgi:hypothetical protein